MHEERSGHEEGGRVPRAVHGEGAAGDRRRGRLEGQGGAGHRQGRRARHRQEHRGGGCCGATATTSSTSGSWRTATPSCRPAADEDADIVGLSGLITPSLDEMVFVAEEMQRRRLERPLLIGGATTSRQHTAVKIAPAYDRSTVHVADASRVIDVVSGLLNPARRDELDRANRADQATLREQYAARRDKPLRSCAEARADRFRDDWAAADLPAPAFLGARRLDPIPLAEVTPFIDWTFFFAAWEIKGALPRRARPPGVRRAGAGAARGRDRAPPAHRGPATPDRPRRVRVLAGPWRRRRHRALRAGGRRRTAGPSGCAFPCCASRSPQPEGRAHRSLADFVAPRDSGRLDHVGAFAVTAGVGGRRPRGRVRARPRRLPAPSWSRPSPTASRRPRPSTCTPRPGASGATGAGERLTHDDLLRERYRGIRPAFGYPACPDHGGKFALWDLLEPDSIGMGLTESAAMTPRRQHQRALPRPPRRALLLGRPRRPRPGGGLRPPQGDDGGRSGALAAAAAGVGVCARENGAGFWRVVGGNPRGAEASRQRDFQGDLRSPRRRLAGQERRRRTPETRGGSAGPRSGAAGVIPPGRHQRGGASSGADFE